MNRIVTLIASIALFSVASNALAQEYDWECVPVDGHMTGCKAPSKDNADETIGTFSKGKYIAPNGKVYRKNSIVARTAKVVMDAQPKMVHVKEVIAYSTDAMYSYYPESPLSNWFIDLLMEETEKLSGRKVDIGITNFGGIRVDMPQGDVLLDDMLSMFPFKNYLTYVEHTGRQIRRILETMAADRFHVLGGVRVVAEGGKLLSAEIGGEPIDDDRIYGVATINFLLEGGDNLTLADNAVSVTVYEDVPIIDAVLSHIKADTAAGRPIEYKTDGRVVVKDYKKRR